MDKARQTVAKTHAPARRRNPARYGTLVGAVLALGLLAGNAAAGHREHKERDIWFVHATDPHLFLKAVKDDEKKEAEKERQQGLNKKALKDMLKHIGSLPDGNGPPAFLLLTGDLGIDPCEICEAQKPTATVTPAQSPSPPAQPESTPKPKDKKPSVQDCLKVVDNWRTTQVDTVANILGESPVSDIYLVAGNNDIANESAGDEALQYFNKFIDDVQKQLAKAKSRVVLHNLTRCYASGEPASTCYADIKSSDYRLIGFPSYSFKSDKDEATVDHSKAQERQFETFRQLLEQARDADRKVVVVTHTPPMDDPYALGQSRYLNPTPSLTEASAKTATPSASPTAVIATPSPSETATPAETPTPAATATPPGKKASGQTPTEKASSVATWKVSQKLIDDWRDLTAWDSVAGVLAGHFHDSHKEIYRQPYVWSSGSRAAFQKLFLAPPLAVKNQDSSPFQARGFSLVHLHPDRIESRLFWYDSESGSFTPDSKHKPRYERCGFWRKCCQDCCAAIRWLWNLDTGKPLERMAVLLIALLTAFLTIIAIWQIPAPADPFPEVKKPAAGDGKPAPAPANAPGDSSPFSSRFGKTVIAGLAGLIAAEVTKTLANEKPSPDSRWYYIVWFIVFFFFLLISLNLWRALVEALRSRFAIVYYPLPRPAEPDPGVYSWGRFGRWLIYRFWAFLHWLKSWLGVPLLTFADTFISLIQGKNQTTTRVFADKIVDQQRNVLRVAKEIREQLNTAIREYLTRKSPDQKRDAKDVRVTISVLSADQTNVFYISKTRDSSRLTFPKRSVAWLSVFTGKIRWYTQGYKDISKDIILFDNSGGTIAEEVAQIPLKSYYQARDEDYEAFVVFPVPLSKRGSTSNYVKGAIHVSFARQADFDYVWSFLSREEATRQVDAKITAGDASERDILRASRDEDIEAAIKAYNPVITDEKYQSEQKMLGDWCNDPGVCATLTTSLRVLGEVLRGFNEQIYKSIAKSEEAD